MYKILVIEDELPVRSNILKILQFEKFDAVGAENGEIGLELAKNAKPDLIICDIMMPQIDGYEVRNRLSQDLSTAQIPFIFLTAKVDKADVRLGMALGADDYLTKPFTRDELLEAVFTRLDKQAAIRQQIQASLDEFRGKITTALPTQLLIPLSQIQECLRDLRTEKVTLEQSLNSKVETAYDASLYLERQIQNFLLYALLEATASNPEKARVLKGYCTTETQSIIHQAAIEGAKAYGRESDLKLELQEVIVPILEANLAKILEELIDNAFKFSSPGNIVLVRSSLNQNHLVIDIFNQGAGLTQTQIDELGAYVQIGQVLNGKGGAGLGFSIVRCLTKLYGGVLTIESVPSVWTTVRVMLPTTLEKVVRPTLS